MKIVVLDGYALNPGDLSWEGFNNLGETIVYDKTQDKDIFERSKEADILITNKTPLKKEILKKLPKLKYIGVIATGYDVVDLEYAKERNIPVTNVPSYGSEAVAQMVFAFILNYTNRINIHHESIMEGQWQKRGQFSYFAAPLTELKGKKLGVIGTGEIGQKVSEIALAFGMEVLAYNRSKKEIFNNCSNFTWRPLSELFKSSDFISLHLPLTEETEGLVNKEKLELMKKNGYLINTARGKLVNEKDLAEALNSERIAGAALDVLSSEPPKADNPLLTAKNCVLTPHIAWGAREARERLMNIAVNNLKAFLKGDRVNVVNN